jgi:HK97 family phage prohead protease
MTSFFARHEVDKKGKGWKPGSEGYPSNGRIAWNLWGGDAGKSWSSKLVRQMDSRKKARSEMTPKKKKRKLSRTERRFVNHTAEPGLKIEYRDCDGVQTPVIRGTAIVFNSESRDLGGFHEKINPESLDAFFERKGDNVDVAALWSHDTSQVLGRTPNTLKLERDKDGLHFELTPPNSRQDIVELVERSDVRGASFAFTVSKGGENWSESEDGVTIREIKEIDELFEISLVLTPAYEATQVGLAKRSLAGWKRRRTNATKKHQKKNAELRSVIDSFKDYLSQRGS